ncbi:hypothetical protein [Deinococcus sp.]|uniref:hypothetical protein n=1 Tax=Deinococcus sp. TaxID=47478 RepID=UPI0025BA35CF|nr:hypothetical protein [Deinococcus sp.]
MTAAPAPTRNAGLRSGLWTALRLVAGWATVAVLAYLLGVPSDSFGWAKMVFAWVLLTLVADEFAGWFGYIGLALGVLPFLHATPEPWFTVFPLVFAALFALLLLKHSGGPFVVPFAALLFMATIIAADKIGIKMKIPLALIGTSQFRNATFIPMIAVMSFSFLRQLGTLLWRWQARRTRLADVPQVPTAKAVPQPTAPVPVPAAPVGVNSANPSTPASSTPGPVTETIVVSPAARVVVPSPARPQTAKTPAAVIDLDLGDVPGAQEQPPRKT